MHGRDGGLAYRLSVRSLRLPRLRIRAGKVPVVARLLVVHEDALGVALQVVELAAAGSPEQDADGHQAEDEHAGNQSVDDFHRIWSGPQSIAGRRNRLRIRAELPITASEDSGMDTAASKGVTKAAMASGTMMAL